MNNLWCTNYSSVRTNTRFTVLFKKNSVDIVCKMNNLPIKIVGFYRKYKKWQAFCINAPLHIDYHGLTAIFQIMFMGDGGIE